MHGTGVFLMAFSYRFYLCHTCTAAPTKTEAAPRLSTGDPLGGPASLNGNSWCSHHVWGLRTTPHAYQQHCGRPFYACNPLGLKWSYHNRCFKKCALCWCDSMEAISTCTRRSHGGCQDRISARICTSLLHPCM